MFQRIIYSFDLHDDSSLHVRIKKKYKNIFKEKKANERPFISMSMYNSIERNEIRGNEINRATTCKKQYTKNLTLSSCPF